MSRPVHPIVHVNYRVRAIANVIVLIVLTPVLYDRGADWRAWSALAVYGLLWPHLALLNGRHGRNTKNAELTNLLVDAFVNGAWIAYLGFAAAPTSMILVALMLAFLAVGGISFSLSAVGVLLAGILAGGVVFGFRFAPETTLLVTVLSTAGLLFYITTFGLSTYRQARRIIQANRTIEAQRRELAAALERQTAVSEILAAISRSRGVSREVLEAIAERAARLCGARLSAIFQTDGSRLRIVADHPPAVGRTPGDELVTLDRGSIVGRAILDGEVARSDDLLAETDLPATRRYQQRYGLRSALAAPLVSEGQTIGALALYQTEVRPFTPEQAALLRIFADQATIALESARLFRELEARTQELEVASRHKSEFLANMSHELRTPLNAVIGFSEVLAERMFGELNDKQAEYVADILASGRHLLSLINDILDLSKIEAGRMELERADFDLPATIGDALTLVRERAARRGIALGAEIDPALGVVHGDQRKVKQVLLNLLSNAVKFTPEGGRTDVRARLKGDVAEIAVADTGVGVAPQDVQAVFEEFRQVGSDAARRAEGTGLGLALARRFVELHGGTIWLESEVGVGSTFTFTLPVRACQAS
ncbi:MAG TPA: ATP-binding protein [Terriglobales bacterium]|nr:ATP-binding protein [Terriglobales bacterium]